MKPRNFIAKYARVFNKARVFLDRKKAAKRGYRKHKSQQLKPWWPVPDLVNSVTKN